MCGGLRTEFRPFSLFCAQNRPPVSLRKIPFPGPRDGEAGAFESLRDLPDLEALKDAGLMRGDALVAEPDAEPKEADAGTGRRWLRSGVASDRVA